MKNANLTSDTVNPSVKEPVTFSAALKYRAGLHYFAVALSAVTLFLLFIGGMVTSTDSGLSVPDWPTTYNYNMFTFPPSMMVGGIFYEHGHRLVASLVGMLVIILCVALFRFETRSWLRWTGIGTLLLVILQGILGGITVIYKLPALVSVVHASVAELFFLLTVLLAFATSRTWMAAGPMVAPDTSRIRLSLIFCVAVFLQIIAGAIIRHNAAGMAIPTFPMAFEGWLPPFWNSGIFFHFLHSRIGALAIVILGGVLAFRLLSVKTAHVLFHRGLGILLFLLLTLQIVLGAFTIWSGKQALITSLHMAVGALIFGVSFLTFLAFCRLQGR